MKDKLAKALRNSPAIVAVTTRDYYRVGEKIDAVIEEINSDMVADGLSLDVTRLSDPADQAFAGSRWDPFDQEELFQILASQGKNHVVIVRGVFPPLPMEYLKRVEERGDVPSLISFGWDLKVPGYARDHVIFLEDSFPSKDEVPDGLAHYPGLTYQEHILAGVFGEDFALQRVIESSNGALELASPPPYEPIGLDRVRNVILSLSRVSGSRGTLLMGIPGTGKSMVAFDLARYVRVIVLKLGRVFGQYVGQSESNMESVLNLLNTLAGTELVIVVLDEVEKLLQFGGGNTDSGVSARVMAMFLTWLQNKPDNIFIVATANDLFALKPEQIRRFDGVFSFLPPPPHVKEKIISFYAKTYGVKYTQEIRGRLMSPNVVPDDIAKMFRLLKAGSPPTIWRPLEKLVPNFRDLITLAKRYGAPAYDSQ